jgi:hypothetical protein
VVAVIGELSWLNILLPKALLLIPLTRFPGFVWIIAAGFALPSEREFAKVPRSDTIRSQLRFKADDH